MEPETFARAKDMGVLNASFILQLVGVPVSVAGSYNTFGRILIGISTREGRYDPTV